MTTKTFPANTEALSDVLGFVEHMLESFECSLKIQTAVCVAIEELFVNIARYAYNPETGPATVRVEVAENPMAVVITFIDKGIPYDPLKQEDPNTHLPAEEREIGGLGIFMVKKTMDDITYEYKDGQNILTIKKNI